MEISYKLNLKTVKYTILNTDTINFNQIKFKGFIIFIVYYSYCFYNILKKNFLDRNTNVKTLIFKLLHELRDIYYKEKLFIT